MSLERIIVLWIALASSVMAEDRFAAANADLDAGRYRDAVEAYEKILEADGPRAGVLQNLGSAWFRLGDDGRAILAFERGLLLEPRHPDLRANLELARERATVFDEMQTGWQSSVAGLLSPHGWSRAVLLGALLLPVAAGIVVFFRARAAAGALGMAGIVLLSLGLWSLSIRQQERQLGIVLGDPATVRLSPFESAEPRGSIPAGRKVEVGREEDGYRWIEAEPQQGWVDVREVGLIREPRL